MQDRTALAGQRRHLLSPNVHVPVLHLLDAAGPASDHLHVAAATHARGGGAPRIVLLLLRGNRRLRGRARQLFTGSQSGFDCGGVRFVSVREQRKVCHLVAAAGVVNIGTWAERWVGWWVWPPSQ